MICSALFGATPARAFNTQTPQDRADPSVVVDELRKPDGGRKPDRQTELQIGPGETDAAISRPILVRSIRLEGASALGPSDYAPAILPYKGRTLTGSQLQDLATAVAEVARRAGYGLASAWIPEQTVADGLLVVQIDEGRIDDLRVIGDGADAVRPYLEGLATGEPVRTSDIERSLLLAGDLPGISIGKPRLDRVGGRAVLAVRTSRDAVRGRAYADNWGSGTVGPVRAHLSVDFNGLLGKDDRLTVAGVLTPLDIKEFGLARIAYAKAVGRNGTEITASAYAARSRPGGILSDREFEGQSLEGSVGVTHPFLRSRAASLWGEIEFSVRDVEQSLVDVTVRKDRFAILKAGTFSTFDLAGGVARMRLNASRGLGLFEATREDDPMRSRRDGSAIFSKLEAWADFDLPLGGPFSMQLQAEGQIASRPLLSSEEMGLGGRYFLRGYDYREYSGDKGVAGSVELRFDLPKLGAPVRSAQLYGYADAGSVGNYEGGTGGGSLASAGGGIRAYLGRDLDASFEIGVPLSQGADPSDDKSPRISFVIGSRF
jgi:hemolysin activation/secretion protein